MRPLRCTCRRSGKDSSRADRIFQVPLFLVPYEFETAPVTDAARKGAGRDTVICIGPEGGYAPQEIDLLRSAADCVTVSLGPRILRAETAAVAAVSIIMYERGFV